MMQQQLSEGNPTEHGGDGGGDGGGNALLTYAEVAKHSTRDDLWVIINNKAYDLTDFADEHPGGSGVVVAEAGKDCTEPFLDAHPESIMKLTLGPKGLEECFRGNVDPASIPTDAKSGSINPPADDDDGDNTMEDGVPPVEAMLNLHDFEAVGQRVMVKNGKSQSWDYYSSGADDELTYNENVNAFQRVWLKPRILVDVLEVDVATTFLGCQSSMPVYLSAVAMCGMGHADGECAWARAATSEGVPFMIPNLSSRPFEDIVKSATDATELMFQIYVNPDRSVVLEQLRACEAAGVKALCITVDSAVPGKRERDLRNKIKMQLGQAKLQAAAAKGTKARKAGNYANRDASLNWDDLEWFNAQTSMKIVLKGVQTGEDAVMAAKAGCAGIILSNHGGRNLDTSRSGIEVLPEVMAALRRSRLQGRMEVFVDGGIRRGTDILKALALGATAVGLGKPAVFSMSAYGQEGIEKMLQILRQELERSMRLVGAKTLADLTPAMVNADDLGKHTDIAPIPASPYCAVPPPKNVRSPPVPEAPKSRAEIVGAIDKLKAQLAQLEGADRDRHGVPEVVVVFARLLRVVAISTGKTVFATSLSGTLHRSALFLVLFLVVHMLGNLLVFAGPDALNEYGHTMSNNPITKFIEAYLLLGAAAHAAVAMYFTWNKRKFIMRRPLANGKLFLSSIVATVFIVLHVLTFRLASDDDTHTRHDAHGRRDLYQMETELFADPKQVAWYMGALAVLGVHLWEGWKKTVLKMDIAKEWRQPFVDLGHKLIPLVFIGFAAGPIYIYLGSLALGQSQEL